VKRVFFSLINIRVGIGVTFSGRIMEKGENKKQNICPCVKNRFIFQTCLAIRLLSHHGNNKQSIMNLSLWVFFCFCPSKVNVSFLEINFTAIRLAELDLSILYNINY